MLGTGNFVGYSPGNSIGPPREILVMCGHKRREYQKSSSENDNLGLDVPLDEFRLRINTAGRTGLADTQKTIQPTFS